MTSSRCSTTGQFGQLQRPYNRVMGVAAAHLHRVVSELRRRNDIVLVHDHQEAFGPTVLAALGSDAPPVLHTLHWDLAKHPELYGRIDGGGSMWVNGVSFAQLATAPPALRALSVGHVHLATPLAVGADRARRRRSPITSSCSVASRRARVSTSPPGSPTASGATSCSRDPSAPHHGPATWAGRTTGPDVRYWREQVQPLVDGRRVRWAGTMCGPERDELVATATAALFPIDWEEPGGTAVVESLALGTPVVGYHRGCLPELVEHGRTGLLVAPGDEDALRPPSSGRARSIAQECRREAARRFTPAGWPTIPAALRRGAAAQRSRGLGEPDAAGRAAHGARVAGPGDRRRPRQRGR